MRGYAIVFEHTSTGWSAYAPGLPGLGVAGASYSRTKQLLREGIDFHIEGLVGDGDSVAEPVACAKARPVSA